MVLVLADRRSVVFAYVPAVVRRARFGYECDECELHSDVVVDTDFYDRFYVDVELWCCWIGFDNFGNWHGFEQLAIRLVGSCCGSVE